MLLLDVNVVIAIHRVDHAAHGDARPWFDAVLERGDDFGVPSTVWASFLRLVTNRRVFVVPTPMARALDFMDEVSAQPAHEPIEPGARHATLLRRLCLDGDVAGDLLPDAVLGAIALEHAATVATFDRDFARFPGLSVVRPAAPSSDRA